jgi:hypothetical protein
MLEEGLAQDRAKSLFGASTLAREPEPGYGKPTQTMKR